jgi:predicted nucleic-acid-binding protein
VIGIDTNVLVRYLVQDDPAQARRVDAFLAEAIDSGTRLHIDDVVLCETVWVLRAAYRVGKPNIVAALDKILSMTIFSFDDREMLHGAVTDYHEGAGDFSDYVIGRRNGRAGCESTVTFDRALGDSATFQLL